MQGEESGPLFLRPLPLILLHTLPQLATIANTESHTLVQCLFISWEKSVPIECVLDWVWLLGFDKDGVPPPLSLSR